MLYIIYIMILFICYHVYFCLASALELSSTELRSVHLSFPRQLRSEYFRAMLSGAWAESWETQERTQESLQVAPKTWHIDAPNRLEGETPEVMMGYDG